MQSPMATVTQDHIRQFAFTAACAAVMALCAAGECAATPAWVCSALSGFRADCGPTAGPRVGKFAVDDADGFVLDRSGHPVLLKFEASPEVWVLTTSHGPRGDILYKNDVGEVLLRGTKLGGMTVYTPQWPEGAAASLVTSGVPIRLLPIGASALSHELLGDSSRCLHGTHHTVGFEFAAPTAEIRALPLISDAGAVALEAMIRLSARPGGKALLFRIGRIVIVAGSRIGIGLERGTLTITVVSSQGYAGRPSSARILQALGAP
jgi:hypothetical protein